MSESTLLEFPCDYPIKVMGAAGGGLDAVVAQIVRRHAPDLSEGAIRTRASRNGNYVAVTVTIRARHKGQLDAIYRELTAHHQVLIAL